MFILFRGLCGPCSLPDLQVTVEHYKLSISVDVRKQSFSELFLRDRNSANVRSEDFFFFKHSFKQTKRIYLQF